MTETAANLIAGQWKPIPPGGGAAVRSHNPARPAETVWEGSPREADVDEAVGAARGAQPAWAEWGIERRARALTAYKRLCEERVRDIASLLRRETGKAAWEAEAEAKLLAAKVDTTLMQGSMSEGSGRARVSDFSIALSPTREGLCSFRPHGVMAVLGPFNFPMHLPNGHIVPALLMGNAVVFKPSDKTPALGQMLASLLHEALSAEGAPPGVVNLVHGGVREASRLAAHDGIDGVLFTGSWAVGRRILEANLDRPGRIIALELGGNNPAVVMPDADLRLAAVECVRAAYATTGQRCTCTRRIIVHEEIAGRFVPLFQKVASSLLVGDPEGFGGAGGPQPFMGPLIRGEAREAALGAQRAWMNAGASVLLESTPMPSPEGGHYATPGLLRVDRFERSEDGCGADAEVFGPIARLCTVRSLNEAIEQANATRYGLAASIFTRDEAARRAFLARVRAGCINVNTGTAGASGKLPFGGLGLSGNHRPAGSFSLDYCAYPVAGMVEASPEAPLSPGMRFEESWL